MSGAGRPLAVFGTKLPGAAYRPRPGAYALVLDDRGRVALVHEENGWYLPGGGLEAGETVEQALLREVRAECACGARRSPRGNKVSPTAQKLESTPDSDATYNRRQPGSHASTSGSSPTFNRCLTRIVRRSTTANAAFPSPVTNARRRASSRVKPCGLSTPGTSYRATSCSLTGSMATSCPRV